MSLPIEVSIVPTVKDLMAANSKPIFMRKGTTAERRSRRWRRLRTLMVGVIAGSSYLAHMYRPMGHYIETDDGLVVRVGMMRWAEWFETHDRRLAVDFIKGHRISTVFLGLNHRYGPGAPLLYETMVFPLDSNADRACDRYCTRAEALEGHAAMVARVIAGEFDSPVTDESETP